MTLLAGLTHLLAGLGTLGFSGAAIWLLVRPRARMAALLTAPRATIAAAAAMAVWCGALWLAGPDSAAALVVQPLRDAAILLWLGASFWSAAAPMGRPLRLVQRLLLTICFLMFGIGALSIWQGGDTAESWAAPTLAISAMIVATGGLIVVDGGVRRASAAIRTPVLAIAGGFAMLWTYELNIQFIGALTGTRATTLIALLPAVALLILPLFVLAAMDVGRERIRLSRSVAARGMLLLAAAAYLVLIGVVGAVTRLIGGDYGEAAQGIFLIAALGIGGLLLLSAPTRAWLSVMISKHFFEHRYEYRAEGLRFTATLGQFGERAVDGVEGVEDGGDLHRRVAKALAELTGSPGALLLVPDGQGGFRAADRWHWADAGEGEGQGDASLSPRSAYMLQETRHIVDLDAERAGKRQGAEDLAIPDWLLSDPRAWVVVPVLHFQRMIAVVVLHRPPVSRALDWEDLDVLRIAGQQAASYLAEAQGQQALSEAKRFDEFNRRFAFIMHDIKNLASQLSLLARNAERHADKPEFRADMIETLRISAGRLSDLLERLSPRGRGPAGERGRVLIEPVLNDVAAEVRARRALFVGCQAGLTAWGDAASIRQIVQHLVTNAIDASPCDTPVQLIAVAEQGRVRIDVIDQGSGMTRAFIRDELFKPFVSTKDGGFGLGAFEAMGLAQAMGGRIEVTSEPGKGSDFSLWLPLADGRDAVNDDQDDRKAVNQ